MHRHEGAKITNLILFFLEMPQNTNHLIMMVSTEQAQISYTSTALWQRNTAGRQTDRHGHRQMDHVSALKHEQDFFIIMFLVRKDATVSLTIL